MTEKATFAAGCFWGVEADFRAVDGVIRTTAGYTGGDVADPSYELVCTDTTNHAEAVLVEFDPDRVSYEDLLNVFWRSHDPTQVNRQGPDVGKQYRSVIFVHTPDQEVAATRSKAEAQAALPRPIATEIVSATEFYPAEDYHQRYLEKRGMASCAITVAPADSTSA